jgi:hypothetical protein
MNAWLSYFQTTFNVFFSAPLDIDFAMLEAFPDTYKGQANRGPQLPDATSTEYQDTVLERTKQVLAANPKTAPNSTGSTYSPSQRELFPWYKYLFIDGSKPVAHMRSMISLKNDALLQALPDILKKLVAKAQSLVATDGRGV